uniref:C2H2-type domain-containing protein n=1 Tax=Clytia hemisphaerica TaxID=252671 RepID=A0A7M5XJS0_9CNID
MLFPKRYFEYSHETHKRKKHVQIKEKEKTSRCSKCGICFNSVSHLTVHIQSNFKEIVQPNGKSKSKELSTKIHQNQNLFDVVSLIVENKDERRLSKITHLKY